MQASYPVSTAICPESEIILPGDLSVHVTAQLRPFNSNFLHRSYPAGVTLAEILEDIQPDSILRRCSHFHIDGDRIDKSLAHRIRPKPGRSVKITCVPALGGGGKKNPLRFILQLAVIAASFIVPALAVPAGAMVFGTLSVSSLVGAAADRCGPLLVNAFNARRDRRGAA